MTEPHTSKSPPKIVSGDSCVSTPVCGLIKLDSRVGLDRQPWSPRSTAATANFSYTTTHMPGRRAPTKETTMADQPDTSPDTTAWLLAQYAAEHESHNRMLRLAEQLSPEARTRIARRLDDRFHEITGTPREDADR